ncbi:MAG: VOC family protein [Saprospiraceae bacterium]|nr:VOC family protein [Saprospiraceae bacterium]
MEEGSITHYSAVLGANNVSASIEFYCFKLGFDLMNTYGNPPYYAEVKRDTAQSLMLLDQRTAGSPTGHASLAFYVEHIDAIYEEFLAKEVSIKEALENKAYGMREFQIEDPDGYLIIFRQKIR